MPSGSHIGMLEEEETAKYWYLSGPMTGIGDDNNAEAFIRAAEELRGRGFKVVNPYETTSEAVREDTEKEERYGPIYQSLLAKDLEVVVHPLCEGVFVLPGWDKSKGARLEIHVAKELGKPIKWADTGNSVFDSNGAEDVLQEAARLVDGGARDKAYGHPAVAFEKAAQIMTAILGFKVEPEQVPLLMIAIKLSRQSANPKRDNLVDIAGYARTAEMMDEYGGENDAVPS